MPGQTNSTEKTSARLEEFVPPLSPESPKNSAGCGKDSSPVALPRQPGSRQQGPNRENQTEGEGKKRDKTSAGLARNPLCRRWELREMLVLLDPGLVREQQERGTEGMRGGWGKRR